MAIGDRVPIEPGFREDGTPVYTWRVEWDEEWFCHVEASDREEATNKAIQIMSKNDKQYTTETHPKPVYVGIVREWVTVGEPKKEN